MVEDDNPFRAPESDTLAIEPSLYEHESVRIRKQYIGHEAAVKSISNLYLLGMIGFGVSFVLGVIGLFFAGGRNSTGRFPSLSMTVIFGVILVALTLVGGGVRKLSRRARIPAAIISALWILLFVILQLTAAPNYTQTVTYACGQLINVYILYLLLCEKGRYVFTPEYQEIIRTTPHVRNRTSPAMLIVLAVLMGILVLVFLSAILF